MILDLVVLLSLLAIIGLVNVTGLGYFISIGDHGALGFGFILLASYVCGRLSTKARMPALTGYLLAGFFFGPNILGALSPSLQILTPEIIDDLSIFNSVALGLIAFSAGGEMKIDSLKKAFKSITAAALGQTGAAALLVIPVVLIFGNRFAAMSGLPFSSLLAASIILAVIAMANSPSSTLALIVEYHAKGPLTTVTLGVTILKDVVVIILFSIAMVAAKLLTGVGGELDLALVGLILWEVLGSLAIGAGLGYLLGKYIDTVGRESPLILLALSFFAMELAHNFHLSGLLLCMATGFFVENYTTKGDALIQAIERYSLPVFVLFFTITGAQLDLAVLRKIWPLVLLLVAVRTFAIWAGTTAGSVFAKDPPVVRKNLWLGFITQAGVSLGLATLIERELPGIGGPLKTTIVAVVAVNQIIGPILFRWGLLTSKEGKTQSPTKP